MEYSPRRKRNSEVKKSENIGEIKEISTERKTNVENVKLRRNDPNHPLTSNGKRRHGQSGNHDENCQIEDYGIKGAIYGLHRRIWCTTHGQWAHEIPINVTYEFEDGTKVERKS